MVAKPLPSRPIAETRVTNTRLMMPMDANPNGNVYGGTIMKYIDEIAACVATRHARGNVVTASIDRMDFYKPVYVGNLLLLKAALNYCGRTSMEIGVRVEAEDMKTGRTVHTGSCYLTFVALDEWGKPVEIPQVTPATDEERSWHEGARRRRDARLKEKDVHAHG